MTSARRRYRRRPERFVVAVQLALDTDGLVYRKWGGEQRARSGDWLVNNRGDCYTVAGEVFERTYQQTGPGTYVKNTPVWAERATAPGRVSTLEGSTGYEAGDYLVSNDAAGSDTYAMKADTFESLYTPDADET